MKKQTNNLPKLYSPFFPSVTAGLPVPPAIKTSGQSSGAGLTKETTASWRAVAFELVSCLEKGVSVLWSS